MYRRIDDALAAGIGGVSTVDTPGSGASAVVQPDRPGTTERPRVAQRVEEDGTTTNLEGPVLCRRALREPPPGVGTDPGVLIGPGARIGYGARFDDESRAVFGELRRASAGGPADHAGVTWERIDADGGVFRPCPEDDRPGTPRLFPGTCPTPEGRARFVAVDHARRPTRYASGPA